MFKVGTAAFRGVGIGVTGDEVGSVVGELAEGVVVVLNSALLSSIFSAMEAFVVGLAVGTLVASSKTVKGIWP